MVHDFAFLFFFLYLYLDQAISLTLMIEDYKVGTSVYKKKNVPVQHFLTIRFINIKIMGWSKYINSISIFVHIFVNGLKR